MTPAEIESMCVSAEDDRTLRMCSLELRQVTIQRVAEIRALSAQGVEPLTQIARLFDDIINRDVFPAKRGPPR